MNINKALAAKRKFVPPKGGGFNLIGVDTFESDPADAAYFIDNFRTRQAAESAKVKRARRTRNKGEKLYIYGPDGR